MNPQRKLFLETGLADIFTKIADAVQPYLYRVITNMKSTLKSNIFSATILSLAFLLTGCASNGDPRDPLEPFNRGVYHFNDTVDKAVMKPIAQGYRFVLPSPVRTGVSNVFSNVDDVFVTVNNLLQGKFHTAASDFARLLANTTLGIGGIFDVASSFGLEKHNEDLGQTFGYWGIGNGPFLMIPLTGPSTVRDAVGSAVQFYFDPVWNIDNVATRNSLAGLRVVNTRANLLDAEKVLDEAALDPYTFLRDAYLQQRRSLVYDGNPPRENLGEFEDDAAGKKAASIPEGTDKTVVAPVTTPLISEAPAAAEVKAEVVAEKTEEKAAAVEGESNGFTTLLAALFGGSTAAAQE